MKMNKIINKKCIVCKSNYKTTNVRGLCCSIGCLNHKLSSNKYELKICVNCNQAYNYEIKKNNPKYCSLNCKTQFNKLKIKKCVVCNKRFETLKKKVICCSINCKKIELKKYSIKYYELNKDKRKKYSKRYQIENKDKINERLRLKRLRDKIKQSVTQLRVNNNEHLKQQLQNI